jgi:Family of unknown function (DUF5683)
MHCFVFAQNSDTTSLVKIPQSPHSASRAAKFSAVLPGLGQVYNKQAWKVPIIYAGAGALIYSIAWNNQNYQKYLTAYKLDSDTSLSTNSEFSGLYTVDNLIVLKDFYRRNRDLSAIGLVLVYAANIVDAYVYGQFFNFDVSDDLSMHIKPFMVPHIQNVHTGAWTNTTGISLQLRFK